MAELKDLTHDQKLIIAGEALLELVEKGIYSMTLTTDDNKKFNVYIVEK